MLTFILIISFIIHCVTIYALIILYLRQNKYKESELKVEKLHHELDEIFQSYLYEMKEENEEIISALSSLNNQTVKKNYAASKSKNEKQTIGNNTEFKANKNNPLKSDLKTLESAYRKAKTSDDRREDEALPYTPPYSEVKDKLEMSTSGQNHTIDHDISNTFKHEFNQQIKNQEQMQKSKTVEDQAVQLQSEGYSIEEIAKKLRKGKTEIELLLKFRN